MKELIFLIVRELFGLEFAETCLSIHSRGKVDLRSLMQETKRSFASLKETLLVLIKHKLVDFAIPDRDNLQEPEGNAEYRLNITGILSTLRYPVFLDLISRLYSHNDRENVLSRTIIELFFLDSSLTVSEVIDGATESLDGNVTEEEVLKVLISLVRGNFLCRAVGTVPGGGGILGKEEEKVEKPETGGKRRRKPKEKLETKGFIGGSKKIKVQEDSLNFLHEMPSELMVLMETENLGKAARKTERIEEEKTSFEKLDRQNALFIDPTSQKEVLLEVNFRQFIHEIRTNVIVETVREKVCLPAALIVQSMLKASKITGPAFDIGTSGLFQETLSIDQVQRTLPPNLKLDSNTLTSQLEVLKNDNGNFVTEKSVLENFVTMKKYAVNMSNIIRNLQIKVFERILSKTHSQSHVRVFRIILKFHALTDKKISENAMISLNEARKLAHDLFKDNILSTQEVIDETDNNNKITVFFVKHRMLIDKLTDNLLKTIYNLKVQKSKLEEELNDPLNTLDLKAKEAILNRILKVESAILDVDSTLMLFTEF